MYVYICDVSGRPNVLYQKWEKDLESNRELSPIGVQLILVTGYTLDRRTGQVALALNIIQWAPYFYGLLAINVNT